MKRLSFFLVLKFVMFSATAQNSIPFMDSCFSYPICCVGGFLWDGVTTSDTPLDSTGASLFYVANAYGAPLPNQFHRLSNNKNVIWGIAATNKDVLKNLSDSTSFKIMEITSSGDLSIIAEKDARCPSKQMSYTYRVNGTSTVVPCFIYLFDNPVSVPDTFFASYGYAMGTHDHNSPEGYLANDWYFLVYPYGGALMYDPDQTFSSSVTHHFIPSFDWGGIFPILELPCPTPAKPVMLSNQDGRVLFGWPEGDSALYDVALCNPSGDSILFTSGDLTDTTFLLTDSLMASHSLFAGTYSLCYRKVCTYCTANYSTFVWSDWSTPCTFYYSTSAAIGEFSILNSQFSIHPNPAHGTVTVTTEVGQGTLTIVDLQGREIYRQAINQSRNQPIAVDLRALAAGTYIVTLATPQGRSSQKLTVE